METKQKTEQEVYGVIYKLTQKNKMLIARDFKLSSSSKLIIIELTDSILHKFFIIDTHSGHSCEILNYGGIIKNAYVVQDQYVLLQLEVTQENRCHAIEKLPITDFWNYHYVDRSESRERAFYNIFVRHEVISTVLSDDGEWIGGLMSNGNTFRINTTTGQAFAQSEMNQLPIKKLLNMGVCGHIMYYIVEVPFGTAIIFYNDDYSVSCYQHQGKELLASFIAIDETIQVAVYEKGSSLIGTFIMPRKRLQG